MMVYDVYQILQVPGRDFWELRIVTIGYSNTSISEANVCVCKQTFEISAQITVISKAELRATVLNPLYNHHHLG